MANNRTLTGAEKEAIRKLGLGQILDDDIITKDELQQLRALYNFMPTMRLQLQKAERAGISTGSTTSELNDYETRIRNILDVYSE